MTVAPKRRWFRYSLRTLFVVVTVFGCWLGWQARIVLHRKSLLRLLERYASESFDPYTAIQINDDSGAVMKLSHATSWPVNPIPWPRRMFGDQPALTLGVPRDMTPDEARQLREAFPEAIISGHFTNKSH